MVYNSPINDWSEDALLWWIVANVPNPIAVIPPNEQAVRSWVSGVRAHIHQHAMLLLNFPAVPK